MNEYLKESLIEAREATGAVLEEMSALESLFFRNKVVEKFMQRNNSFPLWERVSPGYGVHDPKAWHNAVKLRKMGSCTICRWYEKKLFTVKDF